jgi:hypothetical protein
MTSPPKRLEDFPSDFAALISVDFVEPAPMLFSKLTLPPAFSSLRFKRLSGSSLFSSLSSGESKLLNFWRKPRVRGDGDRLFNFFSSSFTSFEGCVPPALRLPLSLPGSGRDTGVE